MALNTPKSESVRQDGSPDGWTPPAGYLREMDPHGGTRLIVSVPTGWLLRLHVALVDALQPPLGLLYRQVVDRQDPKPQGAPPRDFVRLELTNEEAGDLLQEFTDLFHHDARNEVWIRGAMQDQVILDPDGLIFLYPDDPAFEDVLRAHGLNEELETTIVDRDYAKHWFHASNDALEARLLRERGLAEVPYRKR